jgi:hypothetical protein
MVHYSSKRKYGSYLKYYKYGAFTLPVFVVVEKLDEAECWDDINVNLYCKI